MSNKANWRMSQIIPEMPYFEEYKRQTELGEAVLSRQAIGYFWFLKISATSAIAPWSLNIRAEDPEDAKRQADKEIEREEKIR